MIKQKKLLKNYLNQYYLDIRVEESMKGSDFICDYVGLLHHKYDKINPNCSGS